MTPSRPTLDKIRRLFHGGEERGAIAVMLALGLTVLIGSAALAIDLGHLMKVRTESQRVADLAALAGAGAFVTAPGPFVATTAQQWAMQFAALNEVDRSSVVLQSADVQVDVPNERVRVTVYHTQARGNAIPTIFARILGINQVDVVTTAVAQAWPAGGAKCVLPLFLVDLWEELGGDPLLYDQGIDRYEAWDPHTPGGNPTGYRGGGPPPVGHIGVEIVIKPANPGQSSIPSPNPSWYYPFRDNYIPGGANYRDAIVSCTDDAAIYALGQLLEIETGVKQGPTVQGFRDLIALDPAAAWDHGIDCIVDASDLGSGDTTKCRSSVRQRPVPMLDPNDSPTQPGQATVPISAFGSVFVDRVEGNDVYVIFAGQAGLLPASSASSGNPQLKVLRLIE